MDLNTVPSISLLAWLYNPPTVFLKGILESLVLIMLEDVATFHFLWQVHDVGLGHYRAWRLLEHLDGVGGHIAMQLALCCYLVYAIDVVVNLVVHQLLDDLDSSDLREYHVGQYLAVTRHREVIGVIHIIARVVGLSLGGIRLRRWRRRWRHFLSFGSVALVTLALLLRGAPSTIILLV